MLLILKNDGARTACMGVTCVGFKDGKYQLKESDQNVRLVFKGEAAEMFEQVDPPENGKPVTWGLTVDDLIKLFPSFLPGSNPNLEGRNSDTYDC